MPVFIADGNTAVTPAFTGSMPKSAAALLATSDAAATSTSNDVVMTTFDEAYTAKFFDSRARWTRTADTTDATDRADSDPPARYGREWAAPRTRGAGVPAPSEAQRLRPKTTALMVAALPRLLDVNGAAKYLSVSTWTIRDWVAAGHLTPVDLPALRPREGDRRKLRLRRLLFDRAALDDFVDGLNRPSR